MESPSLIRTVSDVLSSLMAWRRRAAFSLSVVLLVGVAAAGAAHAQPRAPAPVVDAAPRPWSAGVSAERQAEALRIFEEGNALFEQSQHAAALARYRLAVESWNHPAIRYNMAVCLIHLDQPLAADEDLRQALAHGAAPLSPELHAQGLTYRKLLDGQLAQLEVVCEEAGAIVTLDGERLFEGPGRATRRLLPGAHQLGAAKAGYLTESRPLTLLPGKPRVEALTLAPIPTASATVTARRRWATWKPWVVVASGLALALVGLPLELQARADIDSYDAQISSLCTQPCNRSDGRLVNVLPLKGRAMTENGLALASFAVGGALAAAGIVLVIVNQPRLVDAPLRRATLAPLVGPGFVGATLDLELR